MKKIKLVSIILIILTILCAMAFVGCSKNENNKSVVSIEKSASNGIEDTYLIKYSDGTTSTFVVKNGQNGADGEDGKSISVDDLFNKYIEIYGDLTYEEFLEKYLKLGNIDNSAVINRCLLSCLKVYTEFKSTTTSFLSAQKTKEVKCGSAVIYKIDDDYTYVITNYHVIYSTKANEDNGTNIASKIVGYLYGSESSPQKTSDNGDNGYAVYEYGNKGLNFSYVGGSADYDIALIKISTEEIKAINEDIRAIEFADEYFVGETAIAIGNPENEGISTSQGIVSIDNEFINLAVDGTARSHRSIRIDTAIYGGSSGGGLFNSKGQLIGITNAGDQSDQNINYAIPLEIVNSVTKNILANYDGVNPTVLKKLIVGVTVQATDSKYMYDEVSGYGKIIEKTRIESVVENSIAEELGLQKDDYVVGVNVKRGDSTTNYTFNRFFEIGDVLIGVRVGDEISIRYQRGNEVNTTQTHIVALEDLK